MNRPGIALSSNQGSFGNAKAASGLLSRFPRPGHPSTDYALQLDVEDRIGLSALGLGGTNAHVVLTSPKAYEVKNPPKVLRETDVFRQAVKGSENLNI